MHAIDFSSMPVLGEAESKKTPASTPSLDKSHFDFSALNEAEEGERIFSAEEEWLKSRWGRFTSSEINRLLALTDDGSLSDGAETYCMEKAAEMLTEFAPNTYTSRAMEWGNEKEPYAVQHFIDEMMMPLEKINDNQEFVLSDDGTWGGTPDGVSPSDLDYGLEVKCPNSTTHISYRTQIKCGATLKKMKPIYYWQVQSLMYLCKKTKWYFMSYDPRFIKREHQSHIVLIERNDDDIEYMLRKIQLAVIRRDMLVAQMDI
ncbi:MAG: hypothetical protein CSB47_10405 [Proteobacteria bacterium]|nr:MAG: hypothetical protein CSB47_10405 [Pseudomonadota bacterium]